MSRGGLPKKLKEWLAKGKERGHNMWKNSHLPEKLKQWRRDFPDKFEKALSDLRKSDFKNLNEHTPRIRWGLIVLAMFLVAGLVSSLLSVMIRPGYIPPPKKYANIPRSTPSSNEDYDSILRRNMFNVEGKIPDPFDQGQLDCFSQAKPSTQKISLLGTIVMNHDDYSVALLQEEGSNNTKIAVKKDEVFSEGKYQALKVERKKFCFMVRATQDYEFIEIPEEASWLNAKTGPDLGVNMDGIIPTSDTEFQVQKAYLDKSLMNLQDILRTAHAVFYEEPSSRKYKGFLIQQIDSTSPFAQLGIRQGDVLTQVNGIVLDNQGKGIEAFQALKGESKIKLEVIRGGQKTTLNYELKQ